MGKLIGLKKLLGKKDPDKSTVLKFKPPEINEDEGEILCNECGGRGSIPIKREEEFGGLTSRCQKCQGEGKLDWVSYIMGKPKPAEFSFSSSSTSSWSGSSGGVNGSSPVIKKAVDAMAKKLAEDIDKEILDTLINLPNKHVKMYNQEVNTFDNGIVSKQLLHPDSEQELKGKANESFISRYFRRFSF